MASIYDLRYDFDGYESTGSDGVVAVTPRAIIAVYRYKYPVTFSRESGTSFVPPSVDNLEPIYGLRTPNLIVVEDIEQLSVSHSKGNHVGQLSASLRPGANYLTEMFPGDWIVCWIVNSQPQFESVLARVKASQQANLFQDGLKFIGKVQSVRKQISQAPTGTRTSRYAISAASFSEFDASVYYEPYLASESVGLATEYLQKTGKKISDFLKGGIISGDEAIGLYFSVFFGTGVPKNKQFQPTGLPDITAGADSPLTFIVPNDVAQILGVQSPTKPGGRFGWVDICNRIRGIQKYSFSQTENLAGIAQLSEDAQSPRLAAIFMPDGADDTSRDLRCNVPISGSFLPTVAQMDGNKTVWSILQQYLNPAINEIYTCLRMSPSGVMPTLVARQLPFSSDVVDEVYKPKELVTRDISHLKGKALAAASETLQIWNSTRELDITRFTELPRWRIPAILVRDLNIGRSDATRHNFIHVYAQSGMPTDNRTAFLVKDPPVVDELDIVRSGLRPYFQTVACSPQESQLRASGPWMHILSDILMGQHMSLNGSIQIVGVQSPICPGDNCQVDDYIFHIESVTHSFSAAPNGRTSFSTALSLTYGAKAEQMAGQDESQYVGMYSNDATQLDPSVSTEYDINKEKPDTPPSVGVAVSSINIPTAGDNQPTVLKPQRPRRVNQAARDTMAAVRATLRKKK